jgi:hypothetical protein
LFEKKWFSYKELGYPIPKELLKSAHPLQRYRVSNFLNILPLYTFFVVVKNNHFIPIKSLVMASASKLGWNMIGNRV